MGNKTPPKIVGYTDTPNDVGYLQVDVKPPLPLEHDAKQQPKQQEPVSQKQKEDQEKLAEMVKPRVLFHLAASMPFQLFKDAITIEEDKVNIVFREFFFAEQLRSTNIKDISHVEVEKSLFYSTLKIASKSFVENYIKIGGLKTQDAQKARRIIEGLKTIAEEDIDITFLSSEDIVQKAEEIGKARGLE